MNFFKMMMSTSRDVMKSSRSSRAGNDYLSDIGSLASEKPNRCLILPPQSAMVGEALERRKNDWIVRTKVASDLIILVGDCSFHLHKLAMVSKSGYLSRLVFGKRSSGEENRKKVHLEHFPGGVESFELVVKFCYGLNVELTPTNISPLYCAANVLEMSEDLQHGNLISQTEAFLSFVLFSSWKDTLQILKSCESVACWAKELLIVKRCSDSIAWKACLDPKAIFSEPIENWWFEDVSTLRMDHFIEVIESIKRRQMKPEIVGSCIAYWSIKWFSTLTTKHLTQQLQRITVESLIKMLPLEKNSVSCNFLLYLLKLGLIMQANSQLLDKLENRTASILERCSVQDLLVKNYGDKSSTYDVGIIIRVVKTYVSFAMKKSVSSLGIVGRLMDGYLTLIAKDINLSFDDFKSLAEALPINARNLDDNLYRALDMYLKAHPSLTEEERTSVCRGMAYHRLSQAARQHAMKNDRLPVKTMTEFMLLEQVNMARSMRDYHASGRTKSHQTIIKVNKGNLDRGSCISITPRREIKMLRKEVENMKMQLNQLQVCKAKLQKQVHRCIK